MTNSVPRKVECICGLVYEVVNFTGEDNFRSVGRCVQCLRSYDMGWSEDEDQIMLNLGAMYNIKVQSLRHWNAEYGNVIVDPDGFDRTDAQMWNRMYTEVEFKVRLARCTLNHEGNKN